VAILHQNRPGNTCAGKCHSHVCDLLICAVVHVLCQSLSMSGLLLDAICASMLNKAVETVFLL
jgi:hypothetical protein